MTTMGTLTRWEPIRDLLALEGQMARLFGDGFNRLPAGENFGAWAPLVDIYEEGDKIVLRAEIPGASKDDIDVKVENGTLTIRGEKKQEKQVDSETAHRIERFYGSFSRSFVLPTSIDAGKITATYKDGVLEVVVPKADAAKPKKVQILGG
ncbi:MAG: molecular chaperone [Acidobacteria bacterium]|nr:MAG: molecular chaperone [Acidobacteriota bacterium]